MRYAVDLVTATRTAPGIALGASPRASVWLVRTAQSRAIADGRDFVLPDDVKALAVPVLAHRLLPVQARGAGAGAVEAVLHLVAEVPVPLHVARKG
jgi:MoxR-like ATPase